MAREPLQHQIAVVGPKGERAIVVALPNPSHGLMDDTEPKVIYGIDGLTVEKISEHEFRDFRGVTWKIVSA